MKKITRKAYKEEISIATDIALFLLVLVILILDIKCNRLFWIGFFISYLLYWWIPNFINNLCDLKFRYRKESFEEIIKRMNKDNYFYMTVDNLCVNSIDKKEV